MGSTLRHQWTGVAFGVVVGLLWTVARVSVPALVGGAINQAIEPGDTAALVRWTAAIAFAAAAAAVFTGLRRYWAFKVSRRTETDLRDRLFAHLQRLHFAFHDRVQTGDLMSRANTDLQQIQFFVVMIPLTISNFVTVVAVTVILVSIDPWLALLALGSLPAVNYLAKRFSTRLHPQVMAIQQESAQLASVVEETVSGVRVVKGFGSQGVQGRRLRTEADDVYEASMAAARVRGRYLPALDLLPNIGLILVLFVGGHQVLDGTLSLGHLVEFNIYIGLLIWPLRSLGQIIASAQRASASSQRVQAVLATAPVIVDRPDPVPLPTTSHGEVRFESVSFGYEAGRDVPVLDDLDLVIGEGQSVALVGATGSGKSTVARLLPRFYEVDSGRILLDGVDVRDLALRDLRQAIGLVFEETFLFSDTIANNIAFADLDADDEQIERAAMLAGADEFIRALPDGYRTEIGERGFSLSGGQRQRIAIARAILADPRVLILDDATSSVDPTKEHEIRDALSEVMRGRTTIVIAHRPATIALADRVVLLDAGRIVAEGTHTELLATSEAYRQVLAAAERHEAEVRADVAEAGVAEEDALSRDQAKWVMRRAAAMLRPYRRAVIVSSALMVLWTASTIAGPLFVRYGIDHGISADSSRGLNEAVVAYVVTAVATYFVYRRLIVVVSQVGEGFLRDLRTRVFDHLQRLSMPFYDREKAGVLVSRMTSDVDSLSELVQMGLVMFAMNTLLLVFSLVVLFIVSWQLALVCMIALPFVVVASIRFQRESNRAYLTIRDRIGHTLSRLQEGISGVRVIQAYGRESTEIERFNGDSRDLYDAHMRSVRAQAWYLPVIEFAGLGTTALVVGIGGWMSIRGLVTIGTIAFFVLTLGNLFDPVQQLSQLFNTVQSAGAGLKKLFELLDTPVEVAERPGAIDLPEQGRIEVDRVSFSYTGTEPVLQDVTLCIEPGERLALVGPTGAGKSTLAKIIARLYDPTGGTVRLGGVDLRDATQRSLRERIVVVPQEGFLFNGTIRENVRIARGDATDDDIDEALRAVGIFERFDMLPDGLATEVRERGSRLSAGEKQLVSLARAALVDPALLVLDEATSSLDPGTELLVESAMDRLMEGRTVVVIAHRLSTAERADRVGVVADGRLVELGRHADLLADDRHYAALFNTWSGGLGAVTP